MRTIVTTSADDIYVEDESVTLNWIAHCMVQGSNDTESDVRRAALQICRCLVEYSALGADEGSVETVELGE
jgi:hypothetical protein